MKTEIIVLASAPFGEDCAQVGSADYEARAQVECLAYRAQLERILETHASQFTREAFLGCRLRIKSNSHDFGRYFEVVAQCTNEASTDVAWWLQDNQPEHWDIVARAEIKEGCAR